GAVLHEGDVDGVGVPGHRLVDGVVDDLPHEVVQTALAGGADVHAGPLADGLEPLEDGDGARVVITRAAGVRCRRLDLGRRLLVCHGSPRVRAGVAANCPRG